MPTKPVLLPLVEPIGARYQSLTVDARLVNAIAEEGEDKALHIYRRPAFTLAYDLGTPGGAGGIYNWLGDIYAIVGTNVYKNAALIGAVAAGVYYFSPCLGASPVLFINTSTNAYTINGAGVVTAVVDPNYPAGTVGGSIYLDGTTYVMDTLAAIHGSTGAGNDPSTWDPLNVILAQIEPQAGIYLAKQLVYPLALKEHYSEAFSDVGNPVGSPLAKVPGAKLNYGCVDARTVRDVGGDLIWVSDTGEGFYSVVMVSNMQISVISTPAIERLLSAGAKSHFYSWNVRIAGHRLYCVSNDTANFSLVYDITSGLWYQWMDSAGLALQYGFSCPGAAAQAYFLHQSNGKVYTLDMGAYTDAVDSGIFSCDIYTPNFDGGTRRTKTLARLDMIGDQVATTVNLQFSDDDYANWSTALTIDMSLDRPTASDLGSFTKRAFHFSHALNAPFRFKFAELYLDVGT